MAVELEVSLAGGNGGQLLEGYAPSLSNEDRHGRLGGGGRMGGVGEKVMSCFAE